jgi:hypothetical protein
VRAHRATRLLVDFVAWTGRLVTGTGQQAVKRRKVGTRPAFLKKLRRPQDRQLLRDRNVNQLV